MDDVIQSRPAPVMLRTAANLPGLRASLRERLAAPQTDDERILSLATWSSRSPGHLTAPSKRTEEGLHHAISRLRTSKHFSSKLASDSSPVSRSSISIGNSAAGCVSRASTDVQSAPSFAV